MKDKSIVTIKPLAYYKMLLHVLRFGSKAIERNKYNEVLGILVGHLEGEGEIKNVVVEEAVPVSHGGAIEVRPDDEQTGAFGDTDTEIYEKYGDLGWFSVGWYHSHPGLTIFFSGTDIQNQMFWQAGNPSGIGIVFDHNYLETDNKIRKAHNIKKLLKPGEIDYGFRTLRLQDPSSLTSDYYEVETIVDLPDSLEYYTKIVEIIDKIHAKEPLILELKETPDMFSSVDIPHRDQLMVERHDINIDSLVSNLKESTSKFIDSAFTPILSFLNTWSQEMVFNTFQSNDKVKDSLEKIKEALSSGISRIQKDFKSSLSYELNEVNRYVSDRFDRFDNEFESIEKNITDFKQELENKIINLFNQDIKAKVDLIENTINENVNALSKINDDQSKNKENIDQNKNVIEEVSQKINSEKSIIVNNLNETKDQINNLIAEKVNLFSTEFDIISNQINEFSSNIETITSMIDNSTNAVSTLKEQINKLKSKNESLENKVQLLESDNPELLDKINNLTALESEKNELDNKLSDLSSQKIKLEQKIEDFKGETQKLQSDINLIKTEKDDMANQLKELERNNAELQENLTNIKTEKDELQKKVDSFEEESQKGKKKKKDKKKK